MKQFIYPYIMVKDSREATDYYSKVFGGKVTYTMLGKDTPNCPEDQLERVMHMELVINDHIFFFADDVIEDKGRIHLHLDFEDKNEMVKAFNKMQDESEVVQELGFTHWGATFGVLIDKFNVTWQFHHIDRTEE